MDFLGIGVAELFLIFIIALIVLGPRRLPEYAAKAGKIVRDLRNMSQGLMLEWQREIAVATRIEELEETRRELQEAQKALRETSQMIRSEAKQTVSETSKAVTEASKAISETVPSQPDSSKQKQETTSRASSDPSAGDLVETPPAETSAPLEPAESATPVIESPDDSTDPKPVNGSAPTTSSTVVPSSESIDEQ